MKISIGADHGGLEYKEMVKKAFEGKYEFIDIGSFELNPLDNYAEIALKVGEKVQLGESDYGIMICRTGVGAVVAMNKMKGIRAGVLETTQGVYLARSKNDINCLAFGADNISIKKAIKIVDVFLNTKFEGGRHNERLATIKNYEDKNFGQ